MITQADQTKIAELVNRMTLCDGVGTTESACSIAAINLALSGRLTDDIPECMSPVIGNWIIKIQDAMPASVRNSAEWKNLLPGAAGTGREFEEQRLAVITDWMWTDVLPLLQPLANEQGFGVEWQVMCAEKTAAAATAAARAARADADAAADAAAARAARAADDAARAARAYAARAAAVAAAAAAADAVAVAAADAVAVAAAADDAARTGADNFWIQVSPVNLLKQLVEVSHV